MLSTRKRRTPRNATFDAHTAQTADPHALATFYDKCKDAYFNTGTPLVDDDTFDEIERVLRAKLPSHRGLTVTGAKGSNNKTKLPYWMGSQDKVYPDDTKAFARWRKANPVPTKCLASVKLDGLSAILVIQQQGVQFLSRGDGTYATDWSHHLPAMPQLTRAVTRVQQALRQKSSPHHVSTVVVRGEAIMSHDAFVTNKAKHHWTSTARNIVSGLLNAKCVKPNEKHALGDIDVVCYEVITPLLPSVSAQYTWLHAHGFLTVQHSLGKQCNAHVLPTNFTLSTLEPLFWTYRKESPYATDGVVVTTDVVPARNTSANPKYAFAFKIRVNDASQTAETTVTDVEWNASRHGYLVPTIVMEPVRIGGVTVGRATGVHYQFIHTNRIGKGARVRVRRCGDVIPNVVDVLQPAKHTALPSKGTYTVSENGVHAIGTKGNVCKQLAHFFKVLGVEGLSEKTVEKFVAHGCTTEFAMLRVSADTVRTWESFQEIRSTALVTSMQTRAKHASALDWVRAKDVFGKGIGTKKLHALATHAPQLFAAHALTSAQTAQLRETLLRTDGFETTTVEQLLTHRPAFVTYWHDVRTYLASVGANVPTFAQRQTPRTKTGDLVGKVYCFTGFRDAALRSQLEARGAVVEDSLTKSVNVVVRKDASVESSTVKKARARGVAVVERGGAV